MGPSPAHSAARNAPPDTALSDTRVLCLGNELIADDGLGPAAAGRLRAIWPEDLDVVESGLSGLYLMEYLEGVARLLVIDSIQTGTVPPGTVLVLREQDFQGARGSSPHYVGLFEALALARTLGLPAPDDVWIIAVEAHDLLTLGAPLHPDVARALDEVTRLVTEIIDGGTASQR
ncbi:MAG: hydrogenase maturation protease [Acidobacteriota bacterium]|jgi:hydrogenase maturation protease